MPSVHKFSYNNEHNYENMSSRPHSTTSTSSRRSETAGSGQFESMFGMARRFPSIRMTPTGKKEKKRRRSEQGEGHEFPRSSGNNINISFGGTMDGLYSKPSKNGKEVSERSFVYHLGTFFHSS